MTQVISKDLAGLEDLILGSGTELQDRGGNNVNITKVNTDWIFSTVAEVKSLDTALIRHTIVINPANIRFNYDFFPSSNAAGDDLNILVPDVGTGRWILSNGAKGRTKQSFVDEDTTPDVTNGEFWQASNTVATTITNFDGGVDGQVIHVMAVNSNTLLSNSAISAGINLKGAASRVLGPLEGATFIRNNAGWWTEV